MSLSKRNLFGETNIMLQCESGRIDIIKKLLEDGVDPNTTDFSGNTALMISSKHVYNECIKVLLENKADPNIKNHNKYDALTISIKKGHVQCVKTLLDGGANPNTCSYGYTALMLSSIYGQSECIEALLRRGAKLCATELIYACKNNNKKCIKILLKAGASTKGIYTSKYVYYIDNPNAINVFDKSITRIINRVNFLDVCYLNFLNKDL